MSLTAIIFGDIVGRPGRAAVAQLLPELRRQYNPSLVIANGENAAHGHGCSVSTAEELWAAGVDVITGGNHLIGTPDVRALYNDPARPILRPLNLAPESMNEEIFGRGWHVVKNGAYSFLVLNVIGQAFFKASYSSPWSAMEAALREAGPLEQYAAIFVDMHGEATSEKRAMGFWLDGKATCVYGTHTHVPTADAQILPDGTAYISDIGMTGPSDSVLGVTKAKVIDRFVAGESLRQDVAEKEAEVAYVVVTWDPVSRKAQTINGVIKRP